MNSLKILLINSFNGFPIGWFGGTVISLAEIITSANTTVTNELSLSKPEKIDQKTD